jgi:hypothetical protein
MSILPNAIYRFNEICIKTPKSCFTEKEKVIINKRWWHMPMSPAMPEKVTGKVWKFKVSPSKVSKTLSQKQKAGGIAQV